METVTDPRAAAAARAPSRWRLRAAAPWLAIGLLLALYALYLARHFAPAISSPDDNGYWAQGSLLAQTGRTWFIPASTVQYVGMHWLVTGEGRLFSRYPPGLAVPIALVYRLFGPEASVAINPALAVLGLLAMFLLGRRLLGPWWGVAGAVALAVTPDFTRHALQCDSHMAVTTLLLWGMGLLLRWHQEGHWLALLGAGIVLGAIPTVRYPEALYALGVGGLLLLHLWRQPRRWPQAVVGLVGASLPVLPLLLRNHLCFGAFWRTAYSLTNEQTGFAWSYFRAHAVDYVQALNADGVGLFFGLGLAGMALMWFRRDLRPWAAFLSLSVVPVTLLYMAYYWVPGPFGGDAAAMRFVLPTFACYYLAGLWLLEATTRAASKGAAAVVTAAVLVCHVVWGAFTISAETPRQCYPRQALARLTRDLRARLPTGAVIISSNAVLQHLDFVRLWRCADISVLRPRPAFAGPPRQSDPEAPAPMQAEKRRLESEKYLGQGDFGRERAVAYDLREWAAGAPVYFVGSDDEIQRLAPSYIGGKYLRELARVSMPDPPAGAGKPGGWRGPMGLPGPGGMAGGGRRPGGGPAPMAGLPGPRENLMDNPIPPRDLAGNGPGMPPAGRFPRGQMPGGLMGLSADIRELVVAEWTWQPAGPR